MPPLTEEDERCAPRATWSCIDEPLKSPGRSRFASLPSSVKGRAWRHHLLRAPGMSRRFSFPTEPQAPRMLDEPIGSLPSRPYVSSWYFFLPTFRTLHSQFSQNHF
jgi:hypothetical protein